MTPMMISTEPVRQNPFIFSWYRKILTRYPKSTIIVLTIEVILTFYVVMMARINVVSPIANIIPL